VAKHVLTNASVTVNSVDLSNHVQSVEINYSLDDVDVTSMGATAREHLPGLRNDEIRLNFFQDFAANSVDATFSPLIGSSAGFTVVVKPTSSAVSSTNPSFTATCILLDYSPLAGEVGAANQTSITLVCNGAVVRATT